MIDDPKILQARRTERVAERRMRSAEHWLALCADAWLTNPGAGTENDMRKARDEWRAREADHTAAYNEAERLEGRAS